MLTPYFAVTARRAGLVFLFLAIFPLAAFAGPVYADSLPAANPAAPGLRYFKETGHNLSGLFLQNYDETGGLMTNGLPLTEEFKDAGGMTVQVFERAIFELHQPLEGNGETQPAPYVEHKLLGAMLISGRDFPRLEGGGHHFFPETGHSLNSGFAAFWNNYGGLKSFGYPLSEEFSEVNPADGRTYTVQYFERARFEYHPEHAGTPYEVQLGLLGRQYAEGQYEARLFAAAKPLATGPQQLVRVPSLMYHHIRDLSNDQELNNYSVTPKAFVEQLDWLQANGYHTVTIAQIADYLLYGIPLPEKPVNLRFDDGWQNQLFAASEMKKRGMTATFFVLTQAVSYPYMTPQQLKQLDADGFEVGSHTRNHPFLTRIGENSAVSQIAGSKADLEKLLGHRVRSFAYPFGDHNPAIDRLVQQAGYDTGATINWSAVWKAGTRYTEPTISVSNIRSLDAFIQRVNTRF